MKKSNHFVWMPEAQEALDSLKNLLKSPPILTAPASEEPMFLYIAATTQVVSKKSPEGHSRCSGWSIL
jgi:hypothetical protein